MADNPQTLSLIELAQQFAGDVVRQINRSTMALRLIPIVVGEGKNVAWVAEADGQLAEEYAEGADAANFGSDAQADAVLTWTSIRSNFRSTGLARAAARTSGSPAGNRALFVRNMINSSAKLAAHENARIFTGSGAGSPKQLTGLNVAIGDDTNTYATINRATETYWRPTVVDPGVATALSLAQIRGDLSAIGVASGEKPDLALCEPDVFNKVVGLFDSTRQYTQDVQRVKTARGEVTLDAGQAVVRVDGCTFVEDKDGTAGWIYYVNTNHVELQVLPQDMAPQIMPGTMLQLNDGFGPVPLMAHYELLATTGDSKKAEIRLYSELAVKKPNTCGVRKNVAV